MFLAKNLTLVFKSFECGSIQCSEMKMIVNVVKREQSYSVDESPNKKVCEESFGVSSSFYNGTFNSYWIGVSALSSF